MSEVLAPVANLGVENYLDDTASHHQELTKHIAVNLKIFECFD